MKKQCSDLNAEYGREVITNQTEVAREISARLNVAGAESKLDATFDAASVSCALKWFYSGPAARTSDGWQLPHLRSPRLGRISSDMTCCQSQLRAHENRCDCGVDVPIYHNAVGLVFQYNRFETRHDLCRLLGVAA
jgi:hypothetical protein